MPNRFERLEFEDETPRVHQEQVRREETGVLGAAPMERHAYHERAVQAFHRGDFEQAMRYFTRTLELDRAFVPAWVGQVQMLIEMDELREADLWADKALALFREHGDLLAARAVAKARLREPQAAMACSDAAIAARGSSAYRWLSRGEVLLATDGGQGAACFDRALLEPDADWFTRLWVARIYRRYGRFTNALVEARQATENAPQMPYAWYIRGLCERDLAIGEASRSLGRALELDSGFTLARAALRAPPETSWLRRWLRRVRAGK